MGEKIKFVQMCQALRNRRHPPTYFPLVFFVFLTQKRQGGST